MSGQELQMLITTVGAVVKLLRNEARYTEQDARLDEQQRKEALQSINLALTESRKYLAAPGEHNNKQKRLEISGLWKTHRSNFVRLAMKWFRLLQKRPNIGLKV